jgi:hypothetical protein
MDEMDLMTTGVEIEEGFRNFIKRLLEAQSYDFMKEKVLFSPKTLKRTLNEFSNIIADELDCDSCTIQLKLYDSKMMDEKFLNDFIYDHLFKTSKSFILEKIKPEVDITTAIENQLPGLLKEWWEIELGIKKAENDINKEINDLFFPHPKEEDKDKIPDYLREFKKSRINWLKSPLVFPYWKYEKGVAGPIAVNNTSPWLTLFKDENNDLKYVTLRGGVSKDIFQENVARVRDRLSIRGTRDFRKLGTADMIVWNNTGWKYVFKNFYGIPIQVHSGGEVIGILRAENKKTRWKNKDEDEEIVIQKLLSTKDTGKLINGIILKIAEKFEEYKRDLDSLNLSLLSLAYLEHDLESGECTGIVNQNSGFEKLIFIPYPDYIISKLKKDPGNREQIFDEYKNFKIDSLMPADNNERPPMQLFTSNIDDEKKLWNLLKEEKIGYDYCWGLYDKIKRIYGAFKVYICDVINYKKQKLSLEEDEKLNFVNKINEEILKSNSVKIDSINIENWHELKLPDFHFKVSLSYKSTIESTGDSTGLPLDIYMVIPPKREEMSENNIPYLKKYKKYKEVNDIWLSGKKCTFEEFCERRQKLSGKLLGEFVIVENSEKNIKVTDLIIDRLAARVQAFADALPIEEFRLEDTYKLKWAAFEIGKLIEREISYRANRHDDPMPLTAMEFYRIPISDFSFVDDLSTRRDNSKKAAANIDVYIKNIISQMEMKDSVKYSSRIKGYRSSLQRIGERFEGYIRGNIAIWVFLLSVAFNNDKDSRDEYLEEIRKLGKKQGSNGNEAKYRKDFLDNLEIFRKSIIESLDDQDFFDNFCKNNRLSQLYGDAKFDSPPFMDEKNWEDVYNARKRADKVLELLETGCNREDIIENMIRLEELINIILKDDQLINNFNELKNTLEMVRGLFEDCTSITQKELDQNLNQLKVELKKPLEEKIGEYNGNLLKAFKRIINNLAIEGLITIDFKEIEDTEKIIKFFKDNKDNQRLFNGLLLRNYSYFVRDSLSLLFQIINLLKTLNDVKDVDIKGFLDFKNFYRECLHLRAFLCSSFRELEGKDKFKFEKIFGLQEKPDEGGAWRIIKGFIGKYKTGTVFPDDNDDKYNYLKLTPKSIYKRIRMLNNILHYQVPAAHLDWELARLDLYGARMNCLFKNQVFVLYEKIWNKGDPFFIYEPGAKEFKEYYSEEGKIDTNKYRQRWVCLRTNILAGEYNACQIAALVDPKTVEPGYWEDISSYNLKCAQYVLGKIFNEFEGTAAEKYRNYSWHRHLISECYRKWYQFKSKLLKRETQNGDKEQEKTKWYGSFLFAGVINLLMLMLNCIIDKKNNENKENPDGSKNDSLNKGIKNRHGFSDKTLGKIVEEMEKDIKTKNLFFEIINAFFCIIKNASSYSNCIKEGFMKKELFSLKQFHCNCKGPKKSNSNTTPEMLVTCEKNDTENCDLYEMAIKIVENIIENCSTDNPEESRDKEIFEKIKESLVKEKAFFTGRIVRHDIEGFQIPIFFFDEKQKDSAGQGTLDNLQQICDSLQGKLRDGKGNRISVNYWDFIYITLKRIRREQRTYLFDKGEKEKNYAGLWMREKTEVLNRIKNYVLLFSDKDISDNNKSLFRGWNAHDLYYYIRSLIPMEIQVRTELANTFAVQYHDDIYKVQTPIGTEFPHAMLKRAGETLDSTDKELEIDYEDYILNVFHRTQEDEEKEKNF